MIDIRTRIRTGIRTGIGTRSRSRAVLVALTAGGALALAACSGATPAAPGGAPGGTSGGTGSSSATTDLHTASTSLGTIVVGGDGRTVYVFDKDTPNAGKSSCSGQCAAAWPEVTTTSGTPTADGVTATLGTITGNDGKMQVTLNGLPLYYYTPDKGAGSVTGQGVGQVWWVVAADGTKIAKAAASASGGGY